MAYIQIKATYVTNDGKIVFESFSGKWFLVTDGLAKEITSEQAFELMPK